MHSGGIAGSGDITGREILPAWLRTGPGDDSFSGRELDILTIIVLLLWNTFVLRRRDNILRGLPPYVSNQ